MQLLAERGFEHGEHEGLGFLPGEVRLLQPSDPQLRIPHIGWNSLKINDGSRLLAGFSGEPCFYFVHSYAFAARDPGCVAATCDYGGEVVAVVERGHIFGTQFHPEKSHQAGLQLLRNFLAVSQHATVELPVLSGAAAAAEQAS